MVIRTGYGGFFLERQCFLTILYDNIKDKSVIHTSKKAIAVHEFDNHAIVTAADGSKVKCQLVAGADGVRSCVRREMQSQVTPVEKVVDPECTALVPLCLLV